MVNEPTLEERIIAYLSRCWTEGALWTGDIAGGLRRAGTSTPSTPDVRRTLKRLAAAGAVEQVRKGNPSSWCLPGFKHPART